MTGCPNGCGTHQGPPDCDLLPGPDAPPPPVLLPAPLPVSGLAELLAALHDFVVKAQPDDLVVLRPSQVVAILNGADDVRRAVEALQQFTPKEVT